MKVKILTATVVLMLLLPISASGQEKKNSVKVGPDIAARQCSRSET